MHRSTGRGGDGNRGHGGIGGKQGLEGIDAPAAQLPQVALVHAVMVVSGGFQNILHIGAVESPAIAVGIGNNQSRHAGSMRAGHRCALVEAVVASAPAAQHALGGDAVCLAAGGGDVHPGVIVRIPGFGIVVGGGCHGKNAAVATGIPLAAGLAVARCVDGDAVGHHGSAAVGVEVVDGVKHRLLVASHVGVTPTVLGDASAVVRRIDGCQFMASSAAGGAEHLGAHQPHSVAGSGTAGNAGDAYTVICDSRHGSRHMAAVVSRDDIGSALVKVVAIHVVHIAVVVIVNAVSGDLAEVDPHVGGKVGMVILDTLVLDADHHVAMAFFDVPGFGQVDVGIHRSAGLAGVVVMPLFAVARVVRSPA